MRQQQHWFRYPTHGPERTPSRLGECVMGRTRGTSNIVRWITGAFLLAANAFGQTAPTPAGSPHSTSQIASANPSGESQIQVANPFATPWLLRDPLAGQTDLHAAGSEPVAKTKPLEKTKYRLEPDPFEQDLPLASMSSQLDARPTLSLRTPQIDTAQRLAAAPPAGLHSLNAQASLLKSKYDVTRIGDRGIGTNLNFYSIEKEQALGRELSQQVEQQAKLISDPVITEYINRIGQTLVRHSDARVPFTIRVVDDEQVNAFALPGGFFYLNTGVLLAADNEAELAGVMAHEIAHVAARHATRNATKQEIWNLASLPLVFVGGPVGAAIRQVSGVVVPMSFLKFSRDAEREADFLGLEYQYASGYDPTAFVDFFERLEAQEKDR